MTVEGMSWPDVVVPALLILVWVVTISPLLLHSSPLRGNREKHRQGQRDSRPDCEQDDQVRVSRRSSTSTVASSSPSSSSSSSGGYVVPVLIHHARILPKESRHSFRYPSIFLALNLQDLEDGSLEAELGWKRIFSWESSSSSTRSTKAALATIPTSSNDHPPAFSPPPQKRSRWTVTKLDPDGFGRSSFLGLEGGKQENLKSSILLKLMYELRLRGYLPKGPQDEDGMSAWKEQIDQVWIVAMPSLLGMGGFNPLTIYYLYRRKGQDTEEAGEEGRAAESRNAETTSDTRHLWLVVLEVHNTFNERHVYICQVGKGEDEPRSSRTEKMNHQRRRKDYQHSWTFPRAFHVSPFNDRSGYYQLLLNDLWSGKGEERDLPTLDVRLLLLTEEGEDDEHAREEDDHGDKYNDRPKQLRKKLLATLTSSGARSASLRPHRSVQPFTSTNMAWALLVQPLDLILPTSRIMWQAAKLHWKRHLPVYIRPEQRGDGVIPPIDSGDEGDFLQEVSPKKGLFSGEGWPIDLNPTQPSKKVRLSPTSSASGAIYWNEDGFIERACMEQFLAFLYRRTELVPDISISIVSRNAETSPIYIYHGQQHPKPMREDDKDTHTRLVFYTLSSSLSLHFALFTPPQARLFGSIMDRAWGVNSIDAYERLFSSETTERSITSRKRSMMAWIRQAHMRWAIAVDTAQNSEEEAVIARQLISDAGVRHPYDAHDVSLSFVIALLLHCILLRLTASVSSLLNIRYVRAPWASVAEGFQHLCQAPSNTPPTSASSPSGCPDRNVNRDAVRI